MNIELCAVGGYSEVGRNMTAVKVDDEAVIFDMGVCIQRVIDYEEEQEFFNAKDMVRIGAIPDDSAIESWKGKVKAIVLTHAHLDHIAAVPYLASKYNCPIIGTPYTIEVLKATLRDKNKSIPNPIIALAPNSSKKLSENLTLEMVNMTHSTPQTAMIALHTKKGTILYANDFKFDNHPILGKKPNYESLKSFAPVLCLIVDSLYSYLDAKTPSEAVAKQMLKDVMLGTENKGKAVVVTTFSSHIARLKSIVEFGEELKRKIVFLGRSLYKYIKAAENIKLVKFSDKAEIIGFSSQIKRKLKQIQKNRGEYLVVCTGNQAEPRSVLMKMAGGYFHFKPEDHVIFSCRTIPTEPNITQRKKLEDWLRKKNIRIFLDIHTSGHCGREDLRDLINMTKPKLIIPAHGDEEKTKPMQKLAVEMGYKAGKNVCLLKNGQKIKL